jgi:hypothetical protein
VSKATNSVLTVHVLPIPTTQLVHGLDDSFLDDTHAETRHVHCIAYEKDELKLLS